MFMCILLQKKYKIGRLGVASIQFLYICVTLIDTIVSAMTLRPHFTYPNTAREQRSHITEHLLQEFNIYFSV